FTHGVRAVLFGSTPAASFSVGSYGQLTAVAPAGSGAVPITVVNEGGQATSGQTFTYVAVAPPPPGGTPLPLLNVIPNAAPARRKGRLSSTLRPTRDLRAPFVFHLSGRLTLPAGVPAAAGCRGRVTVRVQRGRVTIATRRVWLSRSCRYRARIVIANRKRVRTAKRLRVTARFAGNARVLPASGRARLARVRR
ncbi:MAG TPA: hypothetical protein VNT54_09155, partial [Solirubrobacteraceae bacterium]|nr:hypothetical protein [Solirubrobacteraceae bacterium]